jgi:hypothetical protein
VKRVTRFDLKLLFSSNDSCALSFSALNRRLGSTEFESQGTCLNSAVWYVKIVARKHFPFVTFRKGTKTAEGRSEIRPGRALRHWHSFREELLLEGMHACCSRCAKKQYDPTTLAHLCYSLCPVCVEEDFLRN